MRLKQREEARPPHVLEVHLDAGVYPDLQLYPELSREQHGEAIATPVLANGNGADVRNGLETRS